MTKQTSKGRANNAPKKLQEGDAVVFRLRISKSDNWYKGKILEETDFWYWVWCAKFGIKVIVAKCDKNTYLIRSTALEDSPEFKAEQRRAEKRKAAKELAQIEKEARRASLGRYGSSNSGN